MGRQHWLWVTGPDYYLSADGADAPDLAPGNVGWWTCSHDTGPGDLALLYRTAPRSDIAYLFEVTTGAQPIIGGEFDGQYGCEFESRAYFANPLHISDMREDPGFSDFGPLRGKFRRRAYRLDDSDWTRIVQRLTADNPTTSRIITQLERTALSPNVRREKDIENALAAKIAVLGPRKGMKLYSGRGPKGEPTSGQQFHCPPVGFIDLLAVDRHGFVVVEVKKDTADARALGQLLGYMGWVSEKLANNGENVRGVIVGKNPDPKLNWALNVVDSIEFVAIEDIAEQIGLHNAR